jgi:nitrogen fixation protein NifU and related proteins
MARYSTIVIDHFQNPRHLGRLVNPDGTALVTNPICGDELHLDIAVRDGRIQEARFLTRGCTAAIAAGSMVTEMLRGRTLQQALAIREEDIVRELGGLPPEKLHCSVLGCEAIRAAIEDFRARRA